jgi:hypothetical protein
MRKITSIKALRDAVKHTKLIRTTPFSEPSIKKYCEKCVEVPNEFRNQEEFLNWRDYVKSKGDVVFVGRNYVINLLSGKQKLGERGEKLRGYIFLFPLSFAIKFLSKKGVAINDKILNYSVISIGDDNHVISTFIPPLLEEAIELNKKNKLEEKLKIVNRFKRVIYSKPTEGQGLLDFIKSKYVGNNLRKDWEELSTTWREIVFYYLDFLFGFLPGEAKRTLSEIPSMGNSGDCVFYSPTPIEFTDYIDQGVFSLFNNNNVVIVGPLSSGKSMIANSIKSRINSMCEDAKVIDYHDSNNYKYIEKLKEEIGSERMIIVLTDDLYKVLKPKGIVIKQTRVNQVLNQGEKMFEYVYNTIFDADPNKVLWYLPLLYVYNKYKTPIPKGLSLFIMKSLNRNVSAEDIIIKWFSKFEEELEIPINSDYGTDQINNIDLTKVSEKILQMASQFMGDKEFERELLNLFSYHDLGYYIFKKPKVKALKELGDLTHPLVINSLLPLKEKVIEFNSNFGEEYCEQLLGKIDNTRDVIISKKGSVRALSLLEPYSLLSDIRIVLRAKVSKCIDKVFDILISSIKSGRTEWIDAVLDDLVDSSIYFNKLYYLSLISFYYLTYKYSEKIADLVKRMNLPYKDFPLSLILYYENELDKISVSNSLIASLIYGYLASLALSNRDLLKLAILYEKFRRNYNKLNRGERLNQEEVKKISDFVFLFPTTDINSIYSYLDDLKKRLDAGIGYTLLLTHPKEESAKTTLELAEKLSYELYEEILKKIKGNKADDYDFLDLLKIYQIRLMKSLASGEKYEYKIVLQDFIDLERFSKQIKSINAKNTIKIASTVAKLVLYDKANKINSSSNLLDLIIYLGSLLLLKDGEYDNMFKSILSQIKDDSIEKLIGNIILSILSKSDTSKYMDELKDKYYSIMVEILSRFLNDKKRFTVALIPFIALWHITGSRPNVLLSFP